MTVKQYTYDDWYNGKVILIFARRNDELNPTIVDWKNFSKKEKNKIQKEQKSIFEQSLKKFEDKVIKEFLEDYQRTRSKIDLVNRLIKRFSEVFRGSMICSKDYCQTSDNHITFDFWYYQEMKFYIDYHFIGGKKYDFSNVHSPKSIYWNQETVMPEVLVEAFGSMIRLLKSEKNKLQSLKLNTNNDSLMNNIDSLDSTQVKSKTNPFTDIFSSPEAYDLFCDLESSIVIETEYVAGYAFIFHKLKDEKLKFPIKKNVRQVDFCDFLKEKRGQKEIYPPKLPKRNPKRSQIIFEKFLEKYLTCLQSNSKD